MLRLILAAYDEPPFRPCAHGFRRQRGCQTALTEMQHVWQGVTGFIAGDIAACFDRRDHKVWLGILQEQMHDHRFVRLSADRRQAGYLEEWRYHKTLSGSPQGGIVRPIRSDLDLDRLDR